MSKKVSEITVGGTDNCGRKIQYLYSTYANSFAIYRAENNVFIHYADTDAEARAQRALFAPLRPLRGEINVLIRKLMTALAPPDDNDRGEREFYLIQIADALYTGLIDGGTEQAVVELERIKAQLEDRLKSVGRMLFAFNTVWATLGVLLTLALFVGLMARIEAQIAGEGLRETVTYTFFFGQYFTVAALFGALGAWFSIALGLRHNDVRPSNNRLDNLVDPVLRIVIAVLAAMVLFCIVRLDLVTVQIGGNEVSWQSDDAPASATTEELAAALADELVAVPCMADLANSCQTPLSDDPAEPEALPPEAEAAETGEPGGTEPSVADEVAADTGDTNVTVANNPNPQNQDVKWRDLYVAILLAFLAGFSERLVGNLIGTRTGDPNATAPAPSAATLRNPPADRGPVRSPHMAEPEVDPPADLTLADAEPPAEVPDGAPGQAGPRSDI